MHVKLSNSGCRCCVHQQARVWQQHLYRISSDRYRHVGSAQEPAQHAVASKCKSASAHALISTRTQKESKSQSLHAAALHQTIADIGPVP